MLYADFEVRRQLARDHRDELARDMRLARRPRHEAAAPSSVRRALARVHDQVRFLTRTSPAHNRLPQEV
jgi:hypothetical protein